MAAVSVGLQSRPSSLLQGLFSRLRVMQSMVEWTSLDYFLTSSAAMMSQLAN